MWLREDALIWAQEIKCADGGCPHPFSLALPPPVRDVNERSLPLLHFNTCDFRLCSSNEQHYYPTERGREKLGGFSQLLSLSLSKVLSFWKTISCWVAPALASSLGSLSVGTAILPSPFSSRNGVGRRHLYICGSSFWKTSPTSLYREPLNCVWKSELIMSWMFGQMRV